MDMSNTPCKRCHKSGEVILLATTSEFRLYCAFCCTRYNYEGQTMEEVVRGISAGVDEAAPPQRPLLTQEILNFLRPGVFAGGTFTHENGDEIVWVAVRGEAPDWAIYTSFNAWPEHTIASRGDKLFSVERIRSLVPCDDDAIRAYRT